MILSITGIIPLFLMFFAWFLSQYENEALQFLASILALACIFVVEVNLIYLVHNGGAWTLIIFTGAIMFAFFALGMVIR